MKYRTQNSEKIHANISFDAKQLFNGRQSTISKDGRDTARAMNPLMVYYVLPDKYKM
jgi:hypothetical protein